MSHLTLVSRVSSLLALSPLIWAASAENAACEVGLIERGGGLEIDSNMPEILNFIHRDLHKYYIIYIYIYSQGSS